MGNASNKPIKPRYDAKTDTGSGDDGGFDEAKYNTQKSHPVATEKLPYQTKRTDDIFSTKRLPPSGAAEPSRTRRNVDTPHLSSEDKLDGFSRKDYSAQPERQIYTQDGTDESQYLTEIADLNDRLYERKREIESLQNQLEISKGEIASLDDQNKSLKDKIEELTIRLSCIASDRLRDNNPNIADLNDANRPQKIADRFSELYNNEWTNAYAALENTGKSEKDIVKILFKLIKMAYEKCEEQSTEQMLALKESVSDFTGNEAVKIPERMSSSLKTFKDERKRNFQVAIPNILKMIAATTIYKKHCTEKDIHSYVATAAELCWLMCIQDPPLVLGLKGTKNDYFNDEIYRPYTKHSKTVDFYVWPVLHLCENGPLMSKGVAQGKGPKKSHRNSVGTLSKLQGSSHQAWSQTEDPENSSRNNVLSVRQISRPLPSVPDPSHGEIRDSTLRPKSSMDAFTTSRESNVLQVRPTSSICVSEAETVAETAMSEQTTKQKRQNKLTDFTQTHQDVDTNGLVHESAGQTGEDSNAWQHMTVPNSIKGNDSISSYIADSIISHGSVQA